MKTPTFSLPADFNDYVFDFVIYLLIDGIVPALLYLIFPWRWFLDFALAFALMGWMNVANTILEKRKGKDWVIRTYGLPTKTQISAALSVTCLLVYILLF